MMFHMANIVLYIVTEDDMYMSFERTFVCKLVTDGLDVNGLVTEGPDVSNSVFTTIISSSSDSS